MGLPTWSMSTKMPDSSKWRDLLMAPLSHQSWSLALTQWVPHRCWLRTVQTFPSTPDPRILKGKRTLEMKKYHQLKRQGLGKCGWHYSVISRGMTPWGIHSSALPSFPVTPSKEGVYVSCPCFFSSSTYLSFLACIISLWTRVLSLSCCWRGCRGWEGHFH